MAKIIKPLTAKQVESAKSQEQEYYLFDGDNLRLKVTPTNAKIWIYFFEWEGKRKKITIGNFKKSSLIKEAGFTLEEARKMKEKFKLMLLNGERPQNEKKAIKQKQKDEQIKIEIEKDKIFSNVVDDYFAFVTHLSPSHRKNQESRMRNKITIFLGHRSIDSITPQ
ncbi:MAG: Arm DNA-binding domain-containing protein [Arcobacteraceae bacterium]|jgi:hypothetical protein|nr:Arm DNA-binding domain-containing protein [Arcobacteraceae bacterium]